MAGCPSGCEDSLALIEKLQKKLYRPPRYYPPATNPELKFPRHINDQVVALGVPQLSPLQEERGNYVSSFSQYGPRKPRVRERVSSCDPSYFFNETRHGSRSFSGKFDYCPSSTPITDQYRAATDFPSPNYSPIRMGRDLFAPDPSVYRTIGTPPGSPPPPRAPTPPPRSPSPPPRGAIRRPPPCQFEGSDKSCSLGDMSEMMSFEGARGARGPPSPRPGPSWRSPSPPPRAAPPVRRPAPQAEPVCESSCSMGDLSGMMSFERSRGARGPPGPSRRSPSPPPHSTVPPVRRPAPQAEPVCESSCSMGDLSAMMSYEEPRRSSPPRPSPRAPPARIQSPQPEPVCESSCSMGDLSAMMSHEESRRSSPRPLSFPPSTSTPVRGPPPVRRAAPQAEPECDSSCSMGDLSDMLSFDEARGPRESREDMNYTPHSVRTTPVGPVTPFPADLSSNAINMSMNELASIEMDEVVTIQDRMQSFQDARRELVISILTLSEPNVCDL